MKKNHATKAQDSTLSIGKDDCAIVLSAGFQKSVDISGCDISNDHGDIAIRGTTIRKELIAVAKQAALWVAFLAFASIVLYATITAFIL